MSFKVGDKVIDGNGTKGIVIEVDYNRDRPVIVEFSVFGKGTYSHLQDGRISEHDSLEDTDTIRLLTPLEEILE